MDRKYIYPLVIIIVTVALYYADDFLGEENISTSEISKTTNSTSEEFDDTFLPASTTGAIVKHNYFTLSYSEENEQAEWVAYELKKSSGYDRGHLCPAGDRRMSFEAYNETFLTSNISPQDHDFNAGIWNRLEQKVRYWAEKYDGVYIVTGGVLKENLKTIGDENVSVPNKFYKIIVDASGGKYKAVAFLIPNKPSSESFYEYSVSIDEIEARTEIDFFPQLPDSIENKLEQMVDLKAWGRK